MTSPSSSLIEYGLYVHDLTQATHWYQQLFHFPILLKEEGRLHALQAGEYAVLLLFQNGGSVSGMPVPGGFIPPHDGNGPVHLAFSMQPSAIESWEKRLTELAIAIEGRVNWPEGGTSFYFRDPDQHLVELITPRQWKFVPWPSQAAPS